MEDLKTYTDRALLEKQVFAVAKLQGCVETMTNDIGSFLREQERINLRVERRIADLERFRLRLEAKHPECTDEVSKAAGG